MSRMNNTARSLQIISRQNGWDPNQIQGGPDIGGINPTRETPFMMNTTDANGLPAAINDSSYPCPDPGVNTAPSFRTPELRENRNNRTTNADPFPGMPGAK